MTSNRSASRGQRRNIAQVEKSTAAVGPCTIPAHGAPRSEAVEIPIVPFVENPYSDEGMLSVPQTIRVLGRGNEYVPTELISVTLPNGTRERPFVRVRWKCAPFVRLHVAGKTHYGDSWSCFVRDEQEALDSLFDGLTRLERERILGAIVAAYPERYPELQA